MKMNYNNEVILNDYKSDLGISYCLLGSRETEFMNELEDVFINSNRDSLKEIIGFINNIFDEENLAVTLGIKLIQPEECFDILRSIEIVDIISKIRECGYGSEVLLKLIEIVRVYNQNNLKYKIGRIFGKIVAISDSGVTHEELINFYTQIGFKIIYNDNFELIF